MSKFRVGDPVRILSGPDMDHMIGDVGTIVMHDGSRLIPYTVRVRGKSRLGAYDPEELELITKEGGATVARRTFKLIKDTPTLTKGAILQEACDDGTQEYVLLSSDFDKDHGSQPSIYNRALVEEQPSWFVEVFAVEPQYMTREELDQWEAFKVKSATARKAKPAPVGNVDPLELLTTPTKRRTRGHSLESFVRIYNSSRSPRSVAAKTGMTVQSVYARACAARKAGHTLKTMKRAKTAA